MKIKCIVIFNNNFELRVNGKSYNLSRCDLVYLSIANMTDLLGFFKVYTLTIFTKENIYAYI